MPSICARLGARVNSALRNAVEVALLDDGAVGVL